MADGPAPAPPGLADLGAVDVDRLAELVGPASGEWQRRVAAWIGHPGGPLPPGIAAALGGDLDPAGYRPGTTALGQVPPDRHRRARLRAPAAGPAGPAGPAGAPLGRVPPSTRLHRAGGSAPRHRPLRLLTPGDALPSLGPPDLTAVARGLPGAADLDALRRGQLSRRMLMLWALLRSVRQIDLDDATRAGLRDALGVLAAAQRRSRRSVHELLLHPTVGGWLADSLRRCWYPSLDVDPDPDSGLSGDLGYLGGIALAAAIRAGLPCRVPVRVIDGLVPIPTVGAVRSAHRVGWGTARLLLPVPEAGGAGDDGARRELRLDLPDRQAVVRWPADGSEPVGDDGWLPARRLTGDVDGRRVAFLLEDTDPVRDCATLPVAVAGRCDDRTVARWRSLVGETWSIVADTGERATAAAAALSALIPLSPVPDWPGTSVTVPDSLGALIVSPPTDALRLAVALVHEAAHTRLESLVDLAPLIHHAADQGLHYAPWRQDPRPLSSLLHGAYAFAEMADFWSARWARRGSDGSGMERAGPDLAAAFEFAWARAAVAAVLPVLRDTGGLTEAGRRVVEVLSLRAEGWAAVDLPAAATFSAGIVLRDIALVWRLRNLRPDPDRIEGWARAWTAGRPCADPTPPTTHILPWTQPRSRFRHARQVLIGLRFTHPDRWAADAPPVPPPPSVPLAASTASAAGPDAPGPAGPVERPGLAERPGPAGRPRPAERPGPEAGPELVSWPAPVSWPELVARPDPNRWPEPGVWPAGATMGDRHYVDGEPGRAATAFRQELRSRPGRVESFAGLLLILARGATGLERQLYLEHPEALLALGERIRTLTGFRPDPRTLARWIAAGTRGRGRPPAGSAAPTPAHQPQTARATPTPRKAAPNEARTLPTTLAAASVRSPFSASRRVS